MKLKSFLLMALAASTALAACDKSEESGATPDNTPKSVTITLPNIDQTRAMGEALGANQAALKDFKVFFLNAAGEVQEVPQYDNKVQQVYFTSVTIPETGNKYTYHFLPAATTKVVVVGNLGNVTYAEAFEDNGNPKQYPVLNDGDTGTDIKTTDDGKHPLYPLYGEDNLTLDAAATDDKGHDNVYKATVTLTPQVARFEIINFAYGLKEGDTEYSYDALKLEKIALSNYYTKYVLNSAAAAGDVVKCTTTASAIWDWISTAASPWANEFSSFEVGQGATVAVGKNAAGKAVPATTEGAINEIITYGLTKVAASDDNNKPGLNNSELMLAFYGVKDGQQDTPLYLRGKFTGSEAFTPGKIYQVSFTITDGSWTQPERCVELTVKVANWEVVTVSPEF